MNGLPDQPNYIKIPVEGKTGDIKGVITEDGSVTPVIPVGASPVTLVEPSTAITTAIPLTISVIVIIKKFLTQIYDTLSIVSEGISLIARILDEKSENIQTIRESIKKIQHTLKDTDDDSIGGSIGDSIGDSIGGDSIGGDSIGGSLDGDKKNGIESNSTPFN
jgi:methyl-accepting chemotaxis protein